jgi:hypothetical protein
MRESIDMPFDNSSEEVSGEQSYSEDSSSNAGEESEESEEEIILKPKLRKLKINESLEKNK